MRHPAGDIALVSPAFVPWSPIAPVRAWNVRAAARAVRRRAAERHWPYSFDVVWFFSAALAGIEARIPHKLVIYHAVDDYAANPGVRPGLARRRESELLQHADLVFAASEPLAERLRARHSRVVTWENVSDTEPLLAAPQAPRPQGDSPVAAFVGNLSAHKVDFQLLLDVVRRMPDWKFVLAGPLGDLGDPGRRLLTEPNVRYVGPVERADLPRVIGHADVALLPLPAGDLHESSFPMKVFDYLALGLPIVGRRTRALADYAGLILDATSVGQYRAALAEGRMLARQDAFRGRARDTARRNSWSGRMPALEAQVRAALGSGTPSSHEQAEPAQLPQGAALRKPAAQSQQGAR